MEDSQVKGKIQEAALRIFSEKGYQETRIADIAAQADVSTSMIYKFYKGKKELFDSLNRPDLKALRPGFKERRAEIIHEAMICFGEKGFEGTTMDLIAGRVGFSKAMLYQYFRNKEELFSAAMHETSFKKDMEEFPARKGTGNLKEDIYNIGISYTRMLLRPERVAFTRMVIRDSYKYPEIGDIYHQQGFGYIARIVQERLLSYQDREQYREGLDMYLAAKTYVGSLLAFVIQYGIVVGTQPLYEIEEVVKATTEIFLGGILKRDVEK